MTDEVEHRNASIKDYLFTTLVPLQTPRDVLVSQMIDMNEDYTDYPEPLDLCALYDLEEDVVLLKFQVIYNAMTTRKTIEERKLF